MAADIRLLLATARPAVHDFFAGLSFHVGTVAVAAEVVTLAPEQVARATVAVVDVAPDPEAAMSLCSALRAQRPELPILGVVCCPQSLPAWTLRGLLDGGVHGLIDLRTRRDEAERAVVAAALGDVVLQLQLPRAATELLREIFAGRQGRRELQLQLLELVALGLPDHEIGRRLHLSPHTVKHQIEDLRTALRVRNRTELAAWAGKNGFYIAA
jgi:DNA-binding NarL/FixJ family response regulator